MTTNRDPVTQVGQGVTPKGLAKTVSVVLSELESASEEGLAYSWSSSTYSSSGADTILLVKNTSDLLFHVAGVWLSSDTDTIATIHLPTVTVTTPAGTEIFGTNWNTQFSNDADLTKAMRDETVNVQGDIIWEGELYATTGPFYVNLQGAVLLIKNRSIGVDYVAAATAQNVTLIGHF